MGRRMLRQRRSPVVWLLFGQLAMFTGIAAVFPVAPLYVRHRGGGAAAIALFIAGPMLANTLVQLPAGHLADRIGRRPLLIGTRLVYAAMAFAIYADRGPLWLLGVIRAGQGAAAGAYVPALMATLADLTPAGRRAGRYSQLQAAEMVGLLVGPAIGGALAIWQDQAVFGWSGVAVLLGVLVQTRVPETKGLAHREEDPAPLRGWWRSRGVIVASAGLMAVGLVFVMYDVVWPLYLDARGNGTVIIGLSITLFAIPLLLLAGPGGWLADRSDRRAVLGVCMSVAGCCALSYPALRSLAPILLIGTVEATAFVMVQPSLYATLADSAPARARGRAMGIGGLSHFGGGAVGAAGLGSLYGVREGLPFWLAGGTLIATAAVCAALVPARRVAARSTGAAEPGSPGLSSVDDGDDVGRADVNRSVLPGELDELIRL